MSRILPLPNRKDVAEQAAAWIVRLDSERMDATALAEFRNWLARAPDHVRAAEQMAELYDRMDVLALCRSDVATEPVEPRFRKWPALAAAAAVFLALSLWLLPGGEVATTPEDPLGGSVPGEIYSTAIGEQKSIPLQDGSAIKLNTASRVQVQYGPERRLLRLEEGEGFFEVTPDASRPFVVETSQGVVTAVGTAFSVRVEAASMQVMVQNGRVEVSRKPAAAPADSFAATVDQGQSFVLGETSDSLTDLQPAQILQELAWRDGMLVFDGDSLASVIKEVSRYDDLEIVISDPGLRDRRIGGYFRAGETDVLLAALESSFGVQVERVNDKLIYLHPAKR